jgi:protein-tyrosine phosphatase
MVDIHCHILPGLDDGAQEESIAREMARMAADDGITHIVATPHANYRFSFEPDVNRQKRDALQRAIGESPRLLLGCDFHLSYENIGALRLRPERYTINGLQYLLVEFANTSIPPNMNEVFLDMISHGVVPIITHPERNPLLSQRPEQMLKWLQAGCLVQVTAGSLLGRFGKRARQATERLLQHRMVHFVATDAHNTTSRPPLLAEGRKTLAAQHGEEVARALFETNPAAVIAGRELAWRPAPQPFEVAPRKWFSLHR